MLLKLQPSWKKDHCQLRHRPASSIYRWSHGHLLFAREARKRNSQLEALGLPRKIKILSKRREDDTKVLACHEVISSFSFFFFFFCKKCHHGYLWHTTFLKNLSPSDVYIYIYILRCFQFLFTFHVSLFFLLMQEFFQGGSEETRLLGQMVSASFKFL